MIRYKRINVYTYDISIVSTFENVVSNVYNPVVAMVFQASLKLEGHCWDSTLINVPLRTLVYMMEIVNCHIISRSENYCNHNREYWEYHEILLMEKSDSFHGTIMWRCVRSWFIFSHSSVDSYPPEIRRWLELHANSNLSRLGSMRVCDIGIPYQGEGIRRTNRYIPTKTAISWLSGYALVN